LFSSQSVKILATEQLCIRLSQRTDVRTCLTDPNCTELVDSDPAKLCAWKRNFRV